MLLFIDSFDSKVIAKEDIQKESTKVGHLQII